MQNIFSFVRCADLGEENRKKFKCDLCAVVCLWLPLLFLGMEVRHAVNLIKIRLGERWQPISNQSLVTGSPTTNKADCHWWVPKSRLFTTCWVSKPMCRRDYSSTSHMLAQQSIPKLFFGSLQRLTLLKNIQWNSTEACLWCNRGRCTPSNRIDFLASQRKRLDRDITSLNES